MLTRDQILAADDLPREAVEVPEWKGSVFVRALTGAERDQLERDIAKDAAIGRASIVAMVTVDDEGKRLFSEKDIERLGQKHGQALERIVTAALSFNLMTSESISEGKGD